MNKMKGKSAIIADGPREEWVVTVLPTKNSLSYNKEDRYPKVIARKKSFHWWNRSYIYNRESRWGSSTRWSKGSKVFRDLPREVSVLAEAMYHRMVVAEQILSGMSLEYVFEQYKNHNLKGDVTDG